MVTAAQRDVASINFEEGKTEAIWNIVGRGSRARKFAIANNSSTLAWQARGGLTGYGYASCRRIVTWAHGFRQAMFMPRRLPREVP
jgi:hypothetical protein